MGQRLLIGLVFLLWSFAAQAQVPVANCATGTAAGANAATCGVLAFPATTASAVEGSHVLSANAPATLVDFQVSNTSASTLWVMVFDAATAPTGGGAAVTGCTNQAAVRPCVAKWYQIGANATISVSWSPGPFVKLLTGITLACSSSGPFTLTYSVNCVFSGEAM